MLVTVTEIEPPDGNTVTVGYGIEHETDRLVKFALDWRPAMDLYAHLADGEDIEVELEGWQVLSAVGP